jgi:ribosomal-protein-alanine N-acetyltransferase
VRLELEGGFAVRHPRTRDAGPLARHADNPRIAEHLRDAFPNPYGPDDARRFIVHALEQDPVTVFLIVDPADAAIGAVGYGINRDVERFSAEIGYWLAEEFWGRGIATRALAAVTRHAMRAHGLNRLYALPFAGNPASVRVLEKAGYVLEGRLRRSAFKDGRFVDQFLYACVRED